MAILISGINVINNDKSFRVVAGTTAARNATPATGMIRYNTSLSEYEFYNGTVWGPIKVAGAAVSDAYSWGSGSAGNLGDGTTTSKSSPVSVVGGFTDWVQIDVGVGNTVAIRANGTAWGWGNNNKGRLGDGTTTYRSSPVSVVGGFTDWVQVDTGNGHTVGLRANGTAWAWGGNDYGQLGDNTGGVFTDSRISPVSVVGGFTDWTQISAGYVHTVAIRSNGTAWAWGHAGLGRLGNNDSTTSRSSPVSVVGGFTDWVQISAGNSHTSAIRANGTAWGWGINAYYFGAVGDNSNINKSSPVSVVGGFTDWVQVSAGGANTLALRANGTAWGWGSNGRGALGASIYGGRSSPVSVVGGFTDWVQISNFGNHTAAIRANGTAWAWGYGSQGRLGDGTTTNRNSPVSVVGGFTDWVQVSAGNNHTVGIRR